MCPSWNSVGVISRLTFHGRQSKGLRDLDDEEINYFDVDASPYGCSCGVMDTSQ